MEYQNPRRIADKMKEASRGGFAEPGIALCPWVANTDLQQQIYNALFVSFTNARIFYS